MLRTRLIAGPAAGVVLSLILATILVGVHGAETFFPALRFRPGYPAPVTLRAPERVIAERHGSRMRYRVAAVVVRRGTTTRNPEVIAHARAYEESRRPPRLPALLGLWLVYFLVAMLLVTYLRGFASGHGTLLRTKMGVFALIGLLVVAEKALLLLTDLSPLLIPAGALALWCQLYVDRRAGIVIDVAAAFLAGSLVDFNLIAIAVFLAQGIVASLAFRDLKHKRSLLAAGLAGAIGAGGTLVAARMLFSGTFDLMRDLLDPWHSELLSATIGGALAGGVALAFSGAVERILGAVSRAKLLDLVDLEQPLLQKMAREAPGSWEHARAMANLAEAAAAAIHADALLTRAGAYYHDLGKTVQPKYFIENLLPGERSPHDDLEPDVSADAIMTHVVMGTKTLRQGGVPEPVVEFAYTHHGTSVMEYFWDKCQKQGNPKGLTEAHFRYPGMRPRSRETAILMLVDAIEAASRTIVPPKREKFEEMVRRVIFGKLSQGQLDDSGLSVEDLRILAQRLTDTLVMASHGRIAYPWQHEQQRPSQPAAPVVQRPNDSGVHAVAARDEPSGVAPGDGKETEPR